MKRKTGKSICVFSGKGGVGKTILTLNLAGIHKIIGKRVLIMDLDLSSRGISLATNKASEKNIYTLVDDYNNNRFHDFHDYVVKYTENIVCKIELKEEKKVNLMRDYETKKLNLKNIRIISKKYIEKCI